MVDQLLAAPAFGERWAQHWLDLARFADTDGFEHDKVRESAWKYRDWVIDAINQGMPYDRFVQWQIAGDLLASEHDREAGRTATAFCLSGPDMPDINSQEERRHVLLNEMTATVGSVFFSLQVGCAQCHDHMYDPISQADFYRLRAFFEPAVGLKKNRSVSTLAATDDAAATHLMIRGDWRRKGPALEAAFPRIANPREHHVAAPDSAGRRAELARWLTRTDHPLVARTIVNRVWQYHFGRGFSSTPSDFGVMGDEPSHPELLDFLATKLMRDGWSLKRLHREILLSAVYRTRSVRPPSGSARERWDAAAETDPDNRWLSRFPRRRLDAEAIRDALFAVSGSLNRKTGGPGVMPPLPPEMVATLKRGQWKTTDRQSEHYRRSVYLFARRNLRFPFFATFDRPAANASCAVRQPSTTAVQSLLLFNSRTTLDAATRLAARLQREWPDGSGLEWFAEQLSLRLYAREPDRGEVAAATEFLRQQTHAARATGLTDAERAGLVDLCRAMLNSNEFLYVE